jgi:uncharacterized membrane protein
MSELVVVSYKGEDTADQVLNKLRELQKEYLVDLEDAVVVIRDKKAAGVADGSGGRRRRLVPSVDGLRNQR